MKSVIKKYIPFALGRKLRGMWQILQSIFYYGKKYQCPLCKTNLRMLLPGGFDLPVITEKKIIGAGRRPNCICPRCYSTDRDRLIYIYLKNFTNIFTHKTKLLHIAPSGSIKALMKRTPNVIYQEGSKYHEGFYYSKDISLIDIRKLDFDDNTYDVIFCNHVLEHIPEDIQAMKELHRVLKPGGWAILQVPVSAVLDETYEDFSITTEADKEKHFGQFDHVRIYGADYPKRLESAGFTVEKINPSKDWNIEGTEKFATNKDEILYVAHKK